MCIRDRAYSRIGLVMALYVLTIVSLFLPHDVPVSDLYILIVLYALVLVYLTCSAKVSFGSNVSPSIFGKGFVVSNVPFILRFSDFEYSAGSGVNNVHCVLVVFIFRLLFVAHVVIESRYGCRVVSAVL